MVLCLLPCKQLYASGDVEAFIVGSNSSFDDRLSKLQFAELDARRFAEAMSTVGLIPTRDATLLIAPSLTELRRAVLAKEQNKPARKFMFYFSGHSDDAGLHLKDGIFTKSELHSFLSSVKANTKIAILDSCFSGNIAAKGVEPAEGFDLPRMDFDEPSGSVFLTASTGRQFAFESEALGSSVFTHHLLDGIYGDADGDADGIVTIDELYQYVYRNTKWQSLNYPGAGKQEPEIVAKLQGQGAVVVAFPSRAKGQLLLAEDIEGDAVIAAPRSLRQFSVQKTRGRGKALSLPLGSYRLVLRRGLSVGTAEFSVAAASTARIAAQDIKWETAPQTTTGSEKGLVSENRQPASMFWKWNAMFGAHSGYATKRAWSPMVEMGAGRDWMQSWGQLAVSGQMNAHRHETPIAASHRFKTSTISSMARIAANRNLTTIGRGSRLDAGINVSGGGAYIQQDYPSGYSDQTHYTGIVPALGIGLELGLRNGGRVDYALAAQYESLITKNVDESSLSGGFSFGLVTKL